MGEKARPYSIPQGREEEKEIEFLEVHVTLYWVVMVVYDARLPLDLTGFLLDPRPLP